jgi:peptide methionine sulfoxide reductase MsrB
VLANADGRLEVFAIGTDGNLGHAFQNVASTTANWSAWHDLGPLITTNPALARNADGRLEVFANGEGTTGPPALGHMYQNAASTTTDWSGWTNFDDFPDNSWRITGNPAVAQNADGRLEIFAIALDGNLGHIWQNAASTTTNWSAWQDLGPAITSNPAVARNTDGSLEVFAVAPVSSGPPALGHIWQATPGGGWSAWTNFGTIPGEYSTRDDPAVTQNADGRLEIFAIGPDGNLGHMWQEVASTTTSWSGWQDLGPAISGTPAAAANT